MAFWPFGKKKKKQKQENPVESSPLEPKQDQPAAEQDQPAAEPEAAPKSETRSMSFGFLYRDRSDARLSRQMNRMFCAD